MQVNMKFLRSHCDFFFLDNPSNELKEKKVYNNNRKEIYKHYFVNGGAICLTYISTLQKTIKKYL